MPFATHLDGQIEYFVEGEGPPLLLLHGVGRDASQWWENGYVAPLSRHFTVVAANSRGYGNSTPVTKLEHLPYALYRDDFLAVMDDVGADRFAIFGYSRGGVLATLLAMEYPERVTALVAGAANLNRLPEGRPPAPDRRPRIHPRRVAGALKRRILRRLGRGPRSTSRWAPVLAKHGMTQREAWRKYVDPLADVDRAAERITMPALFFQGDGDTAFDLQDTIDLANRLPDARMEVVVGADHGLNRQSERVLPLIEPFLREHAGG